MVTDKVIIDSINKRLFENFRNLDGRPIYRIVWSEDQLEKRFGEWSDWYGHILIRTYKAVKEIKKYWYLKPPCWVLEKLVFMQSHWHLKELMKELIESQNGTYEPAFTFQNSSKKPLPVDEEIVDNIIYCLQNPTKRTPLDWKKVQEIEEKEEIKYFEDELSKDERSPLFIWENSAFVSTNQLKFREEYIESEKG
jgi:hypothetical protein